MLSSDSFVVAAVRGRLELNKVKIDKACVRFRTANDEFGKCILFGVRIRTRSELSGKASAT